MAQISFMNNPHILLIQTNKENIIAEDVILDYSDTDIVFPVLDEHIAQGQEFEFIFGHDILVIADPRHTLHGKNIETFFNDEMIPISSYGDWFACFGVIKKEAENFIVGDINLKNHLDLRKHLSIRDGESLIPIEFK